jgi:hypothetical protein
MRLELGRLNIRTGHDEVALDVAQGESGHRRALGKSYLPAVLDDAGTLSQSDGFTRPSLACCLKCRLGYLKVFDARHMVEDVFAELVPAIDSESEMSASRHCA